MGIFISLLAMVLTSINLAISLRIALEVPKELQPWSPAFLASAGAKSRSL